MVTQHEKYGTQNHRLPTSALIFLNFILNNKKLNYAVNFLRQMNILGVRKATFLVIQVGQQKFNVPYTAV